MNEAVKKLLTPEKVEQSAREFLEKAQTDPDSWQAKAYAQWFYGPDMIDRVDEWMEGGEKTETAFLSYRIHKKAHDVQRQILFSMAKYLFLMAGRRAGKSEGIHFWFVDEFVQKPNARCLYIGLTITKAMSLLWQPVLDLLSELGIKVKEQSRVEGRIVTEGGGIMQFGGNNTKDEREKNRGPWWDRVAIDEAQSQKDLIYLIESIIFFIFIDV